MHLRARRETRRNAKRVGREPEKSVARICGRESLSSRVTVARKYGSLVVRHTGANNAHCGTGIHPGKLVAKSVTESASENRRTRYYSPLPNPLTVPTHGTGKGWVHVCWKARVKSSVLCLYELPAKTTIRVKCNRAGTARVIAHSPVWVTGVMWAKVRPDYGECRNSLPVAPGQRLAVRDNSVWRTGEFCLCLVPYLPGDPCGLS